MFECRHLMKLAARVLYSRKNKQSSITKSYTRNLSHMVEVLKYFCSYSGMRDKVLRAIV